MPTSDRRSLAHQARIAFRLSGFDRQGGKANRRQQLVRACTVMDWVQRNCQVAHLGQLGGRQIVQFLEVSRSPGRIDPVRVLVGLVPALEVLPRSPASRPRPFADRGEAAGVGEPPPKALTGRGYARPGGRRCEARRAEDGGAAPATLGAILAPFGGRRLIGLCTSFSVCRKPLSFYIKLLKGFFRRNCDPPKRPKGKAFRKFKGVFIHAKIRCFSCKFTVSHANLRCYPRGLFIHAKLCIA